MSKHRHPNLPSISTLLTNPPSPPPPIIVIHDEEQTVSPRTKKFNISNTLSPILSPIDSNASSTGSPRYQPPISPLPSPSMLTAYNSSLPPLQGDDPPRRLRHPSISSIGSDKPVWSPSQLNMNIRTDRYYSRSPSPISFDNSPIRETKSLSPIINEQPLPPSTEIILSESGEPVLKRRRGRPPNIKEPSLEGGWTFLTPTVWDVKGKEEEDLVHNKGTKEPHNDSMMAAFTSSNMDMVLQMPRKKRGRKPKTHIAGNSCFVWRDITPPKKSSN